MKKTILILCFVTINFAVFGLGKDSLPTKKIHFGFLLGPNMILTNKFNPIGFTIGAEMNIKITKAYIFLFLLPNQ